MVPNSVTRKECVIICRSGAEGADTFSVKTEVKEEVLEFDNHVEETEARDDNVDSRGHDEEDPYQVKLVSMSIDLFFVTDTLDNGTASQHA